MIHQCKTCGSRFDIERREVGPGGRKLRCAYCHTVDYILPEEDGDGGPDDEEECDEDSELMGTMILSLAQKPRLQKMAAAQVRQELPEQSRIQKVKLTAGQKAELMFKTRWSEGMTMGEVQRFCAYWELFKVAKRTTIFSPGDKLAFLGLILKGEVQILRREKNVAQRVLANLGAQRTFGELSVVDGLPRDALAVTRENTYLLVLTNDKFLAMGKEEPRLWHLFYLRIARLMCDRIRSGQWESNDFIRG